MSCCSSHSEPKKKKEEVSNPDSPPKSIVGKYLYNMGKKEEEKEKHSGKHKGGCC